MMMLIFIDDDDDDLGFERMIVSPDGSRIALLGRDGHSTPTECVVSIFAKS
jgi:hypothetical protein